MFAKVHPAKDVQSSNTGSRHFSASQFPDPEHIRNIV